MPKSLWNLLFLFSDTSRSSREVLLAGPRTKKFNKFPNQFSPNQLILNSHLQNSPNINFNQFYPIEFVPNLLHQIGENGLMTDVLSHVLHRHSSLPSNIRDAVSDHPSVFELSMSEIQTAARSVAKCPNLVSKFGPTSFILIGHFRNSLGYTTGKVSLPCRTLKIVVHEAILKTIYCTLDQLIN